MSRVSQGFSVPGWPPALLIEGVVTRRVLDGPWPSREQWEPGAIECCVTFNPYVGFACHVMFRSWRPLIAQGFVDFARFVPGLTEVESDANGWVYTARIRCREEDELKEVSPLAPMTCMGCGLSSGQGSKHLLPCKGDHPWGFAPDDMTLDDQKKMSSSSWLHERTERLAREVRIAAKVEKNWLLARSKEDEKAIVADYHAVCAMFNKAVTS